MRADIVSFLKLLEANVRYSIPVWQRSYSWNDKTINRLVEDLKAIAEADDENARHFGGTLITYSEDTASGTSIIDHVVDGQQRLTTISILLACIAKELGTDSKAGEWNAEKIRSTLLSNNLDSSITMNLQGDDDSEYRRILGGESEGKGKVSVAWEILSKATTNIGPSQLMKGLNRFSVISFKCSPSDDPQQIFESLNATGVPLTEGEKAKNWLLMGLDTKTQNEVYQNHWRVLETFLGAIEEPKYIDEFLRDFLRWKTGKNSGIRQVYENLRRWWLVSGAGNDKVWLCKDLSRLAKLYGIITGRGGKHGNKDINKLLEYLRGLRIDVHRPFTLRLLDDATRPDSTGADENEVVKVLEAISTWITRLWLADKPSQGLNTEAARLAHHKNPKSIGGFADYWIGEIRGRRNTRIAVPSDGEVREGIRKRKAYGGKASDSAKAVLYFMNSSLGRHSAPPIEELSLEHIMPQTLSKEWKQSLGDDAKEIHGVYLNSLANLTLVGKEINPEISNQIYKVKCFYYKESSFRLTRRLVKRYKDWKENDLLERGDDIADLALKCWPWVPGPRPRGPRWRINFGEWKEERSYRRALLFVTAALLDINPKGNRRRLSGNRKSRDVFPKESHPTGPASDFVQIPRHEDYVINLHASRNEVITRCRQMAQRCGEEVDVE